MVILLDYVHSQTKFVIHGTHQQVQHPQGDHQRHPDQKPCQQIAFKEITFGHFFAMNTSWSYQRDDFLGDYSKLEELTDLKQNLQRWTQGSRL